MALTIKEGMNGTFLYTSSTANGYTQPETATMITDFYFFQIKTTKQKKCSLSRSGIVGTAGNGDVVGTANFVI